MGEPEAGLEENTDEPAEKKLPRCASLFVGSCVELFHHLVLESHNKIPRPMWGPRQFPGITASCVGERVHQVATCMCIGSLTLACLHIHTNRHPHTHAMYT